MSKMKGVYQFISKRYSSCSLKDTNLYDVAIIGGGIIGTAIARKLKLENKNISAILLEKESKLGRHQSSHNSGVIHSGIYYKNGSLKSKLCTKGIDLLTNYCTTKNIPFKKTGKLIVATTNCEVEDLQKLYKRGLENNTKGLELLTSQKEICKFARSKGIQAIWCPDTGNVDFGIITKNFGEDFVENGGKILYNFEAEKIKPSTECDYPILIVSQNDDVIKSKTAIICGGLQSEILSGILDNPFNNKKMVSFKVNYLILATQHCEELNTNVYLAPDLNLPFLGAHFSPKLDGNVLLGPSAVPALKIEGYKGDEINLTYVSNLLTSCGFRNMIVRNFSKCVTQAAKTVCPDIQIQELQKLLPNISYSKIEEGPRAVQCQLLNADGTFVDDFIIDFFAGIGINERIINCKFIPSPGATSALAIADLVASEYSKKMPQINLK